MPKQTKGFKHGDHPVGFSGRTTKRPRKTGGSSGDIKPKPAYWTTFIGGKEVKVSAPKRGWSRTYA
jgi:hypothetical protein